MQLVKLVMLHAKHLTNSVVYVPHCFKDLGHVNVIKLNIVMKRYKAIVNASGMWVETILYAQNQAQAYKLFQTIFGSSNVPHQPTQL
jgi:glycerol-3-phosphate dehydrogenase